MTNFRIFQTGGLDIRFVDLGEDTDSNNGNDQDQGEKLMPQLKNRKNNFANIYDNCVYPLSDDDENDSDMYLSNSKRKTLMKKFKEIKAQYKISLDIYKKKIKRSISFPFIEFCKNISSFKERSNSL